MTGEYDIGSTIEMSQELNKVIKNSELKIVKDGKHLCGIECADEVYYFQDLKFQKFFYFQSLSTHH